MKQIPKWLLLKANILFEDTCGCIWTSKYFTQKLTAIYNMTIDDAINQLGGRYGAQATKDLQSLKIK